MRLAVTLLLAFLALVVQSTILELAPVHLAAPSLALLVVVHAGFSPRWSLASGALLAFLSGYFLDLASGAPQGAHALVFVLMLLGARLLSLRLAVRGVVFSFAIGFLAALVAAGMLVVVRAQVASEGGYGGLGQAPMEALFTGICAPPVMGLLRRIDGSLDPARARVGVARGPRRLGEGTLK